MNPPQVPCLSSCLLSFAILLSGLGSRHWSCHVFQQEQKSSRNHCRSFYPASMLMRHGEWQSRISASIHLLVLAVPFVIAFSQRQGVLGIASSNCGRRTVVGKRHLAAQAASVLGAEKGLDLLPDFTRGFFWKTSDKLNILVCILKPGVRLQRFRQAARMWRVRLLSKGRTHRWNCSGRPWSIVGSTLQKELCGEYITVWGIH